MNPFIANRISICLSDNIDDYPEGIVIPVNKGYRWTSADVIRKIKFCACRHFHKKNLKVGHAGTLDPLATGVLLVCIGKATKMAEEFQRHDKEYVAGVSFGATTPSYDLEKEIDRLYPHGHITEESVREALKGFLGEQEQIAPLFSAKSVDGVRAYEIARKKYLEAREEGSGFDHTEVENLSRQTINIKEIELLCFWKDGKDTEPEKVDETNGRNMRINVCDNRERHLPQADIRVACTKGTYIRALARDLGEALHSGAHLSSLCRTKSGDFSIEASISTEEAVSLFKIF